MDAESSMNVDRIEFGEVFGITHAAERPRYLVVCEHASNRIPADLRDLGLSEEAAKSHIVWDPGALGVAQALSRKLPSVLVEGGISRLVYDCNRPPEAASAIPEKSEVYHIPGNAGLDQAAWDQRVKGVYDPFCNALGGEAERHKESLDLLVTVHSFTPVFNGAPRAVEIGVLHGADARFADLMMANQPEYAPYDTRLNEPYDASDGVTHTLDVQGADRGLMNVMIEIRNDLIAPESQQEDMGAYLAHWISECLETHLREVPRP